MAPEPVAMELLGKDNTKHYQMGRSLDDLFLYMQMNVPIDYRQFNGCRQVDLSVVEKAFEKEYPLAYKVLTGTEKMKVYVLGKPAN